MFGKLRVITSSRVIIKLLLLLPIDITDYIQAITVVIRLPYHTHPLMMIGPLLLKITWNSQVGGSWPGCSGFPQANILRSFHRSDLVLPARLVCLSLHQSIITGIFWETLASQKEWWWGGNFTCCCRCSWDWRNCESLSRLSRTWSEYVTGLLMLNYLYRKRGGRQYHQDLLTYWTQWSMIWNDL